MTPDEYTNSEQMLDVGDGHTLYVQDWGRADAKTPIMFLHGGPGSSCQDKHRENFDPQCERVIFFDQRGSGKSQPYGSLEHNTTDDLIEDVEKIADHFGLKQFILFGSSWGSTLALAYALKYPARVKAMVLRGIFTGSADEADYLNRGGWATHFPEIWDTYLDHTPKAHHDDPTAYHVQRILGSDARAAKESAYAYANMDSALLTLDDRFTARPFDDFDPTQAIIQAHYFQNHYFMPDRHILDHATNLTMPVYLIQGRYDMECPPVTAYELHAKLPNSQLFMTIGGHKAEHETWTITRSILGSLTGEQ